MPALTLVGTATEESLFGTQQNTPKPPSREQWVMMLIALVIALVLTLSYFGIIYVVDQGNQ